MPLLTPDNIVSNYLHANGYDHNVNLLIISENYPRQVLTTYFYRSIYPGFVGVGIPSFLKSIATIFGIPYGNELGMLHNFLGGFGIGNGQRLLIDALPNGAPPQHPVSIHNPIHF